MVTHPSDAERKPFWQGWERPTRLFPDPCPLNDIFSDEFVLSDEHALFVRHEELAPDGDEWGWRNNASEFKTIDLRRTSGYIHLFWDVLLLLAEHPGEIVETHRGDEDFYHAMTWEEEAGTYWIKQWGSQQTLDIRLAREEFDYIIGEIKRAPEGTPYTEEAVDYKGEPTIWHHAPRPADRPDWCEDCERTFAACQCLCWRCDQPVRQGSCPACKQAPQNEPWRWIADRPVRPPREALGPDGRRRVRKHPGGAEYLRPFHYGGNAARGYVASRGRFLTVAYRWTDLLSESRLHPGEDPFLHMWFDLKEYRERTLANNLALYAHVIAEASRLVERGSLRGACAISPFAHSRHPFEFAWGEDAVTIRRAHPDESMHETGFAALSWVEWERLCGNVAEFRSWNEAGWRETRIEQPGGAAQGEEGEEPW